MAERHEPPRSVSTKRERGRISCICCVGHGRVALEPAGPLGQRAADFVERDTGPETDGPDYEPLGPADDLWFIGRARILEIDCPMHGAVACRVQERVAAWLHAREATGWLNSTRIRLWALWLDVVEKYGAGSCPAAGVLLDLVREAWGGSTIDLMLVQCGPTDDAICEVCVSMPSIDPSRSFNRPGSSLEESTSAALVAALEAAP